MSNTINNGSNNNSVSFTQGASFPSTGSYAAAAGTGSNDGSKKSWFESMAKAWGSALDGQADKITQLSDKLTGGANGAAPTATGDGDTTGQQQMDTATQGGGGSDDPSVLTMLTTESLKMQFLSQSASTSDNAVGQALETLGRKQ